MTQQPRHDGPGPGPLWGPAGPAQRTEPVGPPPEEPLPGPAPTPPRRHRLLPVYVTAAAICVLGAILAVAVIRYEPDEEQAAPRSIPAPSAAPWPSDTATGPGGAVDVPTPTTTPAPYTSTPTTTTDWRPPSTAGGAPGPVPVGYRLVSGPEGVQVAVPDDWLVRPGAVPSNMQADAPLGDRLIRFGGSAATGTSLFDTVASNETDNPNIAVGYQRLRLTRVAGMGVEAVDWEFVFTKEGVDRHSYGRYWRLNGIDYVVYASATQDAWPTMAEIVDVMVESARPL